MRTFLLQPYPFNEEVSKKLAVCGGIGLFVALFLAIFKPFGIGRLPDAMQWKHPLLFGVVTFVVSALFQIVLPKIFPVLFREKDWLSWKEILYLLLTTAAIGAGNFLLSLYLYPQSAGLKSFLWSELTALEVGGFPVLGIVIMKQMNLYRRYAAEAKEVTKDIEQTKPISFESEETLHIFQTGLSETKGFLPPGGQPPLSIAEVNGPVAKLVLRGDNQKEELSLIPHDLLFIASADNYVNVHYREAGKPQSLLLRGSLKKFEEQLSEHTMFLRCHRMYIINLQVVTSVSGNAQGLKLYVAGIEEAVAVSRSLTDAVKEKLHGLFRSPQNP